MSETSKIGSIAAWRTKYGSTRFVRIESVRDFYDGRVRYVLRDLGNWALYRTDNADLTPLGPLELLAVSNDANVEHLISEWISIYG